MDDLKTKWPSIKFVRGSVRHPQSQGGIERANQILKAKLDTWVLDHGKHWSKGVEEVVYSMNTTYSSSIRSTAYRQVYGQDPRSDSTPTMNPSDEGDVENNSDGGASEIGDDNQGTMDNELDHNEDASVPNSAHDVVSDGDTMMSDYENNEQADYNSLFIPDDHVYDADHEYHHEHYNSDDHYDHNDHTHHNNNDDHIDDIDNDHLYHYSGNDDDNYNHEIDDDYDNNYNDDRNDDDNSDNDHYNNHYDDHYDHQDDYDDGYNDDYDHGYDHQHHDYYSDDIPDANHDNSHQSDSSDEYSSWGGIDNSHDDEGEGLWIHPKSMTSSINHSCMVNR